MGFLDAKKFEFVRVNHWTLAKKLLDINVPLFIFRYTEQEFVVRCVGNLLSTTFRCSNGKGLS